MGSHGHAMDTGLSFMSAMPGHICRVKPPGINFWTFLDTSWTLPGHFLDTSRTLLQIPFFIIPGQPNPSRTLPGHFLDTSRTFPDTFLDISGHIIWPITGPKPCAQIMPGVFTPQMGMLRHNKLCLNLFLLNLIFCFKTIGKSHSFSNVIFQMQNLAHPENLCLRHNLCQA
jgi:hypothetical protein